MTAGANEVTLAKSAQVMSPVSIMVSWTTDKAVSRPVIPIAACAHSHSLCSLGVRGGVIGSHDVDGAVRQALTEGLNVGVGTERRVDLVDGGS